MEESSWSTCFMKRETFFLLSRYSCLQLGSTDSPTTRILPTAAIVSFNTKTITSPTYTHNIPTPPTPQPSPPSTPTKSKITPIASTEYSYPFVPTSHECPTLCPPCIQLPPHPRPGQVQFYIVVNLQMKGQNTQADFAQLLQRSEQQNLKHKTKIIEIENELSYERSRANEYEAKFRDAVLQSAYSSDQDILEKLTSKENELNQCRREVIELNRRLTNAPNSPSQNDLIALAHENEELMANIEEIKNAAISAIMMKEEEIEELAKTIARYELMENELKFQYDKCDSLEREFDLLLRDKDEEIKDLADKIAREREAFLAKLEAFQREATQEEHFRESLLEKAQDLEGNLEKSEMVINDYEKRIYELEAQVSHLRIAHEQDRTKDHFEIEDLRETVKAAEKEERALTKLIEELRNKEKNALENVGRLQEANDELTRKLSIKKKKENKAIRDKVSSSFSGISKANPVYASFAFRAKDSIFEDEPKPKHLGEIPEMEEMDNMIENFAFNDLSADLEAEKPDRNPPISQMMTKKKDRPIETTESQPAPSLEVNKQLQSCRQNLVRLQAQRKELQQKLNSLYNQMQKNNESLITLTNELQQERKNTAELRSQLKKTKKESELIVEVQSLNLHVEKLEKDMITSKLKYAEEADYVRDKYSREKVIWTQKLVQLTEQIARQDLQINSQKEVKTEEKKKKKGFFG